MLVPSHYRRPGPLALLSVDSCIPAHLACRWSRVPLAWLAAAALVLSGCSFTHQVRRDVLASSRDAAMVSSWPLAVGVYVAPEVRTFEAAGPAWRMPAGTVIARDFEWTVGQMFDRTVALERPPRPGAMPPGLDGAIALEAVRYDLADPAGDPVTTLRYELRLASGDGETLDEWSLQRATPLWDAADTSIPSLMQTVASEFAYLMRNVMAEMMVRFDGRPAVRRWLDRAGATAPLEPALRGTTAESRVPPRILIVPDLERWLYTDASRSVSCLGKAIEVPGQRLEVLPVAAVRLDFFPWLEPSTGPRTADSLRRLLESPAVRSRIQSLGIRYLLRFSGATDTDWSHGGILCGAGYGGGGCLGFAWGERNTSFRVTVLPVGNGHQDSDIATENTGPVVIPAFGLPIPIIAATETTACRRLRRSLAEALVPRP